MFVPRLFPLIIFVLPACAHSAHSAKPEDAQAPGRAPRSALVGQPCHQLPLGSDAVNANNARIFVEVAEVTTAGLPRPLGRWLDGRAVEIRSTAHLVAFPNVPTTTPWGLCVDAQCSSMKESLTLTAQLPKRASDPIPVVLRMNDAQVSGEAGKVLFETTLEVNNQEPTLLPATAQVGQGSVVITAYLLRHLDDLQRMLECTADPSVASQK